MPWQRRARAGHTHEVVLQLMGDVYVPVGREVADGLQQVRELVVARHSDSAGAVAVTGNNKTRVALRPLASGSPAHPECLFGAGSSAVVRLKFQRSTDEIETRILGRLAMALHWAGTRPGRWTHQRPTGVRQVQRWARWTYADGTDGLSPMGVTTIAPQMADGCCADGNARLSRWKKMPRGSHLRSNGVPGWLLYSFRDPLGLGKRQA